MSDLNSDLSGSVNSSVVDPSTGLVNTVDSRVAIVAETEMLETNELGRKRQKTADESDPLNVVISHQQSPTKGQPTPQMPSFFPNSVQYVTQPTSAQAMSYHGLLLQSQHQRTLSPPPPQYNHVQPANTAQQTLATNLGSKVDRRTASSPFPQGWVSHPLFSQAIQYSMQQQHRQQASIGSTGSNPSNMSSMIPLSLQGNLSGGQLISGMMRSAAVSDVAQALEPGMVGRPPTQLFMSCDADSLSEYQCLVRRHIELFEAVRDDVESNAQGRNRPIIMGQVGIRCRHCTMLPPKHRARGAIYYPTKLHGLYQAAQNMASSHLCEHCQHVPQQLRSELLKLKDRKSSAGGGKKYWADGIRILGVFEDGDGLRFEKR
ncbi:predicted protein [Phaeodactylum tricornutum CCAP 1055/1]|uniref:Uncharacterized protein n=1 Tax=Phaeodactylum tricornutum (strain CCAP 1055/1) TaxID=556484 RepID=B7G929_PHATC|nr:predicted protein [Phaeodactylum tricornutum CCAP 1055/1]EEC44877.1 predicted protein [Phaeodactylum tricornutum CCAP 1055/1]|eukprot:XP_002183695.1 predicted protein [Phaeodactylum tricornutum CCAP 1055/1]